MLRAGRCRAEGSGPCPPILVPPLRSHVPWAGFSTSLRVSSVSGKTGMHDTGCLGLVHWDDPEGWNGEGGGRRVQDGEHM